MLLEKSRDTSRRNEEAELKWKHHPAVDVSGGESKAPRDPAAAAAAKSLQSCPTLCNPIDGSPPKITKKT